jgi:uncharacterized protein (TIGR03083 family)
VSAYEELTPDQRTSLEIDLGFLPQPVPLATSLGMRLNETALHAWDVEVGLDPSAGLSDESARLLLDHFSSTMTFLLGFVGRSDGVPAARVVVAGTHTIVLDPDEGVRLEAGTDGATATLEAPAEAAVRLLAGRLKPAYTPAGGDGHGQRDSGRPAEGLPGVLSFRPPGRPGRAARSADAPRGW